jgi:hypothetical protein
LHNASRVQSYIKKYGARKVEADALVARPVEGRQLCRQAIEKYLGLDAIKDYEQELEERRQEVREILAGDRDE